MTNELIGLVQYVTSQTRVSFTKVKQSQYKCTDQVSEAQDTLLSLHLASMLLDNAGKQNQTQGYQGTHIKYVTSQTGALLTRVWHHQEL